MSDDFVAVADPHRHEGEPDGISSVSYADGVLASKILAKLLFEFPEHRTKNMLSAHQHFIDVRINFFFDAFVLSHVTIEWRLHIFSLML